MNEIPPNERAVIDKVVEEGSRRRAVLQRRRQGGAAAVGAVLLAVAVGAVATRSSDDDAQVTADGGRPSATVTTASDGPEVTVAPDATDEGDGVSPPSTPIEASEPPVLEPGEPCRPEDTGRRDGLIAFTAYVGEGTDVVVVEPDGSNPRTLIPGGAEPAWSPDGTRIAYTKGTPTAIFVAEADGSDEQMIVSSDEGDHDPAWSPDGRRLVFVRGDENGESDLYVVDVDGSGLQQVTTEEDYDRDPAWSPDGSTIVFSSAGSGGLAFVAPDGSARRDIPLLGPINEPQWSADGRCLVFDMAVEEANADGLMMSRIWTATADGVQLTQLTPSDTPYPGHDYDPVWSPSGRTVAFASARPATADSDPVFTSGVWTIGPGGASMVRIVAEGTGPSWQPLP